MIKPKKSLGQNFLRDGRIISRIIKSVSPLQSDLIIEIGPGTGALTVPLGLKAAFVVAIEADAALADLLRSKINTPTVRVLHADALALDWDPVLDSAIAEFRGTTAPSDTPRVRVVANLPYYISTAILQILIEHHTSFYDYTLMLQDEVVDRIASRPGGREYGYLSVLAQYYCEVEKLFEVPPSSFKPAPKVQSAVIRLTVRKSPPVVVGNESEFFRLVRLCFAQRRKTLLNNLKAAGPALIPSGSEAPDSGSGPQGEKEIGAGEDLAAVFDKANIDPKRRAQTLSLVEFARLYTALHGQ